MSQYTVYFTDNRDPPVLQKEAITVEAPSQYEAIPKATAQFFGAHSTERIEDFLVNCPSS